MQEDTKTSSAVAGEQAVSLDGVRYAALKQPGGLWRMGTVNPRWMECMPATASPSPEQLAALEAKGVFLAPRAVQEPKLALVCCGQGGVWPGMGRELYDSFPACRQAMDRLAACASWDVLSLMDEPDLDVLGLTRWQQPYLFLLEYAQFALFRSLGLKPSLFCGHSLGELIALCFAGVYSPETCWFIMDTRSQFMAELEEKAEKRGGMMAVYAGQEVLDKVQAAWPGLLVSNYNTPNQFILSGPRDQLAEARRALRREHHPAVVLNMKLAFHHPQMRVARSLSYRMLCSIEMHPPKTPLMSCVTTGFYPPEQPDICRYIVDLDESAVKWLPCVQNMWCQEGVRHFLETGPQDTLCGFIREIEPRAVCLAASSRGRERESMRLALARLYALGHLRHSLIREAARARQDWPAAPQEEDSPADAPAQAPGAPSTPGAPPAAPAQEAGRAWPAVRALLAEASGRPEAEIQPSQDLRFDLSLRSSSFPRFLARLQEELGCTLEFEDLLHVATAGDLARAAAGACGEAFAQSEAKGPALGSYVRHPFFVRCDPEAPLADGRPAEARLNCARPGLAFAHGSVAAVFGGSDALCAELLASLMPLGLDLRLPEGFAATAALAARYGCRVLGLCLPSVSLEHSLDAASRVDLMLVDQDAARALDEAGWTSLLRALTRVQCAVLAIAGIGGEPFSLPEPPAPAAGRPRLRLVHIRIFPWEAAAGRPLPSELGDLFAREVCQGTLSRVDWRPAGTVRLLAQPLVDDADASPFVMPAAPAETDGEDVRATGMILKTRALLSADGEPCLGQGPRLPHARTALPHFAWLRVQMEAASLHLPWLAPAVLADLRVMQADGLGEGHAGERSGRAGMARGLVREACASTWAGPWMLYRGAFVRPLRGRVRLRGLSASGRRTGRWTDMSTGIVFMGAPAAERELAPLWDAGLKPASGRELDCAEWYRRQGIGQDLQLLYRVSVGPGGILEADLVRRNVVALEGARSYHVWLAAVEGMLQGAAMAFDFAPPRVQGPFSLSKIGVVLLGRPPCGWPLRLAVKRIWDAQGVVHCDAQAIDPQGGCVACATNIEFDGARPAVPADADGL